ncbi:MAG: DNA double-strand break repair nuclease NurA [Candidatus Diapherotrites archaeon]
MGFHSAIQEAVQRIQANRKEQQGAWKRLGFLREKNLQELGKEFLESAFATPVQSIPSEGKIAGTDSGFEKQELHALDLTLIRAGAVCFEYEKNALKRCTYWPSSFTYPEPFLGSRALEREESEKSVSVQRLLKEVEACKEIIERDSPRFAFLDGSLVPQFQDKPNGKSELNFSYETLVFAFQQLYETAEKNKCQLVGCVEDSRGNRIKQMLEESLHENLNGLNDIALLEGLLHKGERSFVFSYTKSPQEHAIVKDFSSTWQESLHAFYLRPSLYDVPLRVEFVSKNPLKDVQRVAETVYAQSSAHQEYAFPAVLIEADLRAKLRPEEVRLVNDQVFDQIGRNVVVFKRRDRRPFA